MSAMNFKLPVARDCYGCVVLRKVVWASLGYHLKPATKLTHERVKN